MDLFTWISRHDDKTIIDTVVAHLKRKFTISDALEPDLRQEISLKYFITEVDVSLDDRQILSYAHHIARSVLVNVLIKQAHPISLCRTRSMVAGFNFQPLWEGCNEDPEAEECESLSGMEDIEAPESQMSQLPIASFGQTALDKLESLLPRLTPMHSEVLQLLLLGENRLGIARELGRTTRRIDQLMREIEIAAKAPEPAASVLNLVERLLQTRPTAADATLAEPLRHAL